MSGEIRMLFVFCQSTSADEFSQSSTNRFETDRVDGEVILEADHASQIDNMEGIDVRLEDDGSVRLTMVSDDNHSLLQRTLMLEFRLVQ